MSHKRLNWDEYFMEIAKTASQRSDCMRAQVGAIVVNPRKKVKGSGYNNSPAGVEGCSDRGYCFRIKNKIQSGTMYETCRSIHAEQNAIIQAGEDNCAGSSIYIYGHNLVCILCKRFILNSGIKKVFLKKDNSEEMLETDPQDWIAEL
ncbi:cytidine/deoxycytidylate deaminase family protein [Spirochaetota bacterium]